MTERFKNFIVYVLAMAVITMFTVYYNIIQRETERKRELENQRLIEDFLSELENEPQTEVKNVR